MLSSSFTKIDTFMKQFRGKSNSLLEKNTISVAPWMKNLNICMTESVCVNCLTLVNVCLSVRDDGLPVDPQGLDREQVYCSVLQPCQDTQPQCASDARFSTPLPLRLPLSFLMSLSLSQPFLPTSLFPNLPLISLLFFSFSSHSRPASVHLFSPYSQRKSIPQFPSYSSFAFPVCAQTLPDVLGTFCGFFSTHKYIVTWFIINRAVMLL